MSLNFPRVFVLCSPLSQSPANAQIIHTSIWHTQEKISAAQIGFESRLRPFWIENRFKTDADRIQIHIQLRSRALRHWECNKNSACLITYKTSDVPKIWHQKSVNLLQRQGGLCKGEKSTNSKRAMKSTNTRVHTMSTYLAKLGSLLRTLARQSADNACTHASMPSRGRARSGVRCEQQFDVRNR